MNWTPEKRKEFWEKCGELKYQEFCQCYEVSLYGIKVGKSEEMCEIEWLDPSEFPLETLLDVLERLLHPVDKTCWGYRIKCHPDKEGNYSYSVCWLDCLGGRSGNTRAAAAVSAICALIGLEEE